MGAAGLAPRLRVACSQCNALRPYPCHAHGRAHMWTSHVGRNALCGSFGGHLCADRGHAREPAIAAARLRVAGPIVRRAWVQCVLCSSWWSCVSAKGVGRPTRRSIMLCCVLSNPCASDRPNLVLATRQKACTVIVSILPALIAQNFIRHHEKTGGGPGQGRRSRTIFYLI